MYTYHTMLFLLLRFGCLAHTAVIGVLELSSPPLVAAERIELPLHGSEPCALPFGYAAVEKRRASNTISGKRGSGAIPSLLRFFFFTSIAHSNRKIFRFFSGFSNFCASVQANRKMVKCRILSRINLRLFNPEFFAQPVHISPRGLYVESIQNLAFIV